MSSPDSWPCPNCGSSVRAFGSDLYCSRLCEQASIAVRLLRLAHINSSDHRADVVADLEVRSRLIAARAFSETARELTHRRRRQVLERAEMTCEKCGSAAGTEIVRLRPSSDGFDDLEDLSLICATCHAIERSFSLAYARDKKGRVIARHLRRRSYSTLPLQPSDAPEWDPQRWAAARPTSSQLHAWVLWSIDQSTGATPRKAAIGYPRHLDPWSWYGETAERPAT